MDKVFVRSAYNYDMFAASEETAVECRDASLAVQDARDDADINTIVKKFGLTGELPNNVRMPSYGDFTGVSDYREAIHAVMEADAAFMQLPADVRKRFDNDPALFVDFCSDPNNYDEAKSLGLLKPGEVAPKPIPVKLIADPTEVVPKS